MPLHNGKLISAEDAIAQDLCPECGGDLKTSNAVAHFNKHWQKEPPSDKRGDKCRARRLMLTKYISDHNVRTSNQAKPAAGAVADLP